MLKDFCSKYDLVVSCSEKNLQDSLKKDYMEAIQEYVSDWSLFDRKGWLTIIDKKTALSKSP